MAQYTYVATTAPGRVEALQKDIPTEIGPDQALIKVEYSSLTPFDLYQADSGFYVQQYPGQFGLNASGTVSKVGDGVNDLKEGDRVVAFSYNPVYKGMHEYTVQPRSVIAKVPANLSLEEAVTIPDNLVTSFYTLFNQLSLPWREDEFPPKETPPNANRPILIYGAGATSGQYAIQLLKLAKYTNIIAVASSKHTEYLKSIGAGHVVDYRSPSLVDDVAKAVGGDGKVELVVDCVSLDESFEAIAKVIRPGGKLSFLGPLKHKGDLTGGSEMLFEAPPVLANQFPKDVEFIAVRTFLYQQDERLANTLMPVIVPRLLEQGLIKPNAIAMHDKGRFLERVNDAFDLLRENKVGGRKVVVKVSD